MAYLFVQHFNAATSFFMPQAQRTILIAEPHPETRELYAASLNSLELEVQTCGTLEELRQAMNVWKPDVLLFRLALPPGLSLIRELKRRYPTLSIIILGEV